MGIVQINKSMALGGKIHDSNTMTNINSKDIEGD